MNFNIQKKFLIIAIAICSYFVILQYNKDYENLPVQSTTSTQVASVDSNGVPILTVDNSNTSLEQANNNSNKVKVLTDVFDLSINLQGGDIEELKLLQYPVDKNIDSNPLQMFQNQGQTYIAQSGLLGANAPDSNATRALWETDKTEYKLEGDKLIVDLKYTNQEVNFIKRFTFVPGVEANCVATGNANDCIKADGYKIDISYLVDNQSSNDWTGNLWTQFKRDSSGDPISSMGFGGVSTYLGAAVSTSNEKYLKVTMKDLDKGEYNNFKEQVQNGYIAWVQHYFLAAWLNEKDSTSTLSLRKDNNGNYLIGQIREATKVAANSQAEIKSSIYVGPKVQNYLGTLSSGLDLTVDYGILWFIAQPIFWLLKLIHAIVGNWGWAIILLTCVIKGVLFPLSAASYKSMAKMKAVAPKMQEIKERNGDNKEKLSKEMMELYSKEKINPLGGCLPILIQMPVFLSLYWVLLEAVEIRHAPWILWIQDLASKDPYFLLPIVMGASMYFQQKLNPAPTDPTQAKVMQFLPIIFTFFFLFFPAGLVLYWVVNNILSIAQQWYITNKIVQ